jgi:hypothetical protein
MAGMDFYPKAAMERAMKVQEVMLRALAKKITWWQAAEIVGISDRSMRRWRERYEEFGYDGLFDRPFRWFFSADLTSRSAKTALSVVKQGCAAYRGQRTASWHHESR